MSKREQLYDNLIKSGKVSTNEIGTKEQFVNALSSEDAIREFHKNLSSVFSADEIGSADDFYGSVRADLDEEYARSLGIGEETIRKGKEILGFVEKEEDTLSQGNRNYIEKKSGWDVTMECVEWGVPLVVLIVYLFFRLRHYLRRKRFEKENSDTKRRFDQFFSQYRDPHDELKEVAKELYGKIEKIIGKYGRDVNVECEILQLCKSNLDLYKDLDKYASTKAKASDVVVKAIDILLGKCVDSQRKEYERIKSKCQRGKNFSKYVLKGVMLLFVVSTVVLLFSKIERCSDKVVDSRDRKEYEQIYKKPETERIKQEDESESGETVINEALDYGNSNSVNNNTNSVATPQVRSTNSALSNDYAEGYQNYPNISSEVYEEVDYITGDEPYNYFYGKGKRDYSSLSELKVINYSNSDAVIILEDGSGNVVRNNFIDSNETYVVKHIPSGVYVMKVMYGHSWNPEKDNGAGYPKGGFMKDISFSGTKWSDAFDFTAEETAEGINYPVYSVTLHKVVNGNLETKSISESEFFK